MTPEPNRPDEREAADVLARLYISAGLFNMLKEPDYTATRSALDRAIALLRRDAPREGASVDDAMVERFCTATMGKWPSASKHNDDGIRAMVRAGITAALADRAPREGGEACQCGLRTKLVGDGCAVCNPEYAADHRPQPAGEEGYPGIAHDFETMKMQLAAARYFFQSPGSFSQEEFQAVGRKVFGCAEYTGRLPFAPEVVDERPPSDAPERDAVGALVGKWFQKSADLRARMAFAHDSNAARRLNEEACAYQDRADELAAALGSRAGVDEAMVERAVRAYCAEIGLAGTNKLAMRAALTAALSRTQEPQS